MRSASVLSVAACLAVGPYLASANVGDDLSTLVNRCRGLNFNSWSEQGLRSYLLERGIISPGSTYEKLVTLAQNDCKTLADEVHAAAQSGQDAVAAQFSSVMSVASSVQTAFPSKTASVKSKASAYATHMASDASRKAATASTMATKAWSSTTAAADKKWHDVTAYLDDTKDYVYSSWSNADLLSWLSEHGIELPSSSTREAILEKIRAPFARENYERPYERLSTSYLQKWLVEHGYLRSDAEKTRDELQDMAKKYYYFVHDNVFDFWNKDRLHKWLVDHQLIKSDYEATRDQLLEQVREKYSYAVDSVWSGWKESDMRQFLVRRGVIESGRDYTLDELRTLMQEHAHSVSTTASKYVSWSDAKLRGFLKDHGVSVESLPSERSELLRTMRAYYSPSWSSQWHESVGSFLERVKDSVRGVFGRGAEHAAQAEDALRFNAEKMGSYAATASSSAQSMLRNEL